MPCDGGLSIIDCLFSSTFGKKHSNPFQFVPYVRRTSREFLAHSFSYLFHQV